VGNEHLSGARGPQTGPVHHGFVDRPPVEDGVGNNLCNVSIDTLASSVASLGRKLGVEISRGKKSVYFQSLEEAHAKGALELELSVTALGTGLVGQNVGAPPRLSLLVQEIVLQVGVGEAEQTTVGVHVAEFGERGIETLEHDVDVTEYDGFRIGEYGHRLWNAIFNFLRNAARGYRVQERVAILGLLSPLSRTHLLQSSVVRVARTAKLSDARIGVIRTCHGQLVLESFRLSHELLGEISSSFRVVVFTVRL